MARRQIPVHESMLTPRRPGILESIGERLGVDPARDGKASADAEEPTTDVPAENARIAQEPADDTLSAPGPESADATDTAWDSSQTLARDPTGPHQQLSSVLAAIDARILGAKGKQALYIRLPREMHEYLEDLSYRLSKTNRDASMTNLVAQAIADKYPDALEPPEAME